MTKFDFNDLSNRLALVKANIATADDLNGAKTPGFAMLLRAVDLLAETVNELTVTVYDTDCEAQDEICSI